MDNLRECPERRMIMQQDYMTTHQCENTNQAIVMTTIRKDFLSEKLNWFARNYFLHNFYFFPFIRFDFMGTAGQRVKTPCSGLPNNININIGSFVCLRRPRWSKKSRCCHKHLYYIMSGKQRIPHNYP